MLEVSFGLSGCMFYMDVLFSQIPLEALGGLAFLWCSHLTFAVLPYSLVSNDSSFWLIKEKKWVFFFFFFCLITEVELNMLLS